MNILATQHQSDRDEFMRRAHTAAFLSSDTLITRSARLAWQDVARTFAKAARRSNWRMIRARRHTP
jgi:hypothetical protein